MQSIQRRPRTVYSTSNSECIREQASNEEKIIRRFTQIFPRSEQAHEKKGWEADDGV